MFLHRKKNKTNLVIIFSSLLAFIIFIQFYLVPSFKGNLEQEFRIFLKQPILYDQDENLKSNLENLSFSFKNKFKSSNLNLLEINIPFENYLVIKSDRKKALYEGYLDLAKEVNGKI